MVSDVNQFYVPQTYMGKYSTINPEIFGVKIFLNTSKNLKIKNTKIFQWYLFGAKRVNTVWISFVENVQQQLLLS